jgi:tetratricopeptide (TPR) repeat protein
MTRLRASLVVLAAAALAACTSTPTVVEPPVGRSEPATTAPLAAYEAGTFEQRQRERAADLERQGRLADAALVWEVLTVLQPDSADYAERLAAARRVIDTGVAVRLQRAQQAQGRGDLDTAQRLYLSVLALQPHNAQASEALRSIDRDRNRRLYLGKSSRVTLARQPSAPTPPSREDSNDVEHASILLAEGEVAEAIALLERRVRSEPRPNDAVRRLLAEAYKQRDRKLKPLRGP